MNDFRGQQAAARAFDNASPDESESFIDEAVAQYAAGLIEQDEFHALVDEIYSAMPELLNSLSSRERPSYDVTTLLGRLRRMAKSIEAEAERLEREARAMLEVA